jgi:hypothetical protein
MSLSGRMTPRHGAPKNERWALRGSYIRVPRSSFSLQFKQMSELDPARTKALTPPICNQG